MTALRPAALLCHRLAVWPLAVLTLWGAFSPALIRLHQNQRRPAPSPRLPLVIS
ncbi:hypothetical protein SAMN05428957_101450 [Oryzisolibacter propanilivorax]|uniref:Uncharacterized protein n=1 Tax=Oryzisolibacter propanilivorax TaxID=1527607 RepID=A0A1G9PJ71_9BURK|nr:hypothetical protein [Oryzisolibacter propanilivorax]SDL98830.1 hypothetical protein SAMN05428957_101450 [Oryzisolibacter propanilivorax]